MYRKKTDMNRNNLPNSMIEFISLKYSEDTVDLFLKCKQKSINYGSKLLLDKETSDNFLQFIINNLYFQETDLDNEDKTNMDEGFHDSYDY